MTENNLSLPQYPVKCDLWDTLTLETRPIIVYGMGNGADKLFARFEKYGIKVSDIFASDGFVRGHSFRGMRVKSFSEIKKIYSDFVIVLSFASNRTEVLQMLEDIDNSYEMYIPDMPVAGEEYFDKAFYNANYQAILSAYNALTDAQSKSIFAGIVNYKLTGKLSYLVAASNTRDEMYSLLACENIRIAVDAGAYNGDTAREAINYFPRLEKIYAIEPDKRNFRKLSEFADSAAVSIVPVNAAAWSENKDGMFMNSGNRNSSINSTASHKHNDSSVRLMTVDSLELAGLDYIKYDVEGSEYEALIGSENSVLKFHPAMLVSLYHRSCDMFFLVNYLKEKYSDYEFYVRRLYCVPAWELNLIMIPKRGKNA